MKIIHHTGVPYELNPNTRLELTRTNPFFSKMGEQSLPITLPASPHNLQLLRNPGRTDNRKKLESRLDASIESGIFFINARQAVLSAKNKDKITTSFYLRNGAFFEKMNDVSLMEVFANERYTIRFPSVDNAITFCRNLMTTRDPRFACFPVATENHWINQMAGVTERFVNAVDTQIDINDRRISVPRGMFISPFIRVRHVVEEALDYLGYTLAPGSFLDTAPFNDMVFLNDTLDTIASGTIRYIDIVPNITISTLFDVLRKFNVEPMPNETLQTVSLVSFNQVLASPVQTDLSECIHKEPTVNFHHEYKQLKLSSQRIPLPDIIRPFSTLTVRGNESTRVSTIDTSRPESSLIDILARFPNVYIDRVAGSIRARGFRGEGEIDREVGSLSLDYYAGDAEFAVDEKRFPDIVPEIISTRSWNSSSQSFITSNVTPYCGRGRFVQSTLEFSDESYSELSDDRELRPMLCLVFDDNRWSVRRSAGTLSNFNLQGQRLWNFSLMFNGADGIFERFWRQRDNLLRNALLEVEYDLLLSEKHKFTLSALEKVMLNNQEYLIDEIKYTPEERDIKPCRFLSVRQQYDEDNQLSTANTEAELFPAHPFRWVLRTHHNFRITPSNAGSPLIRFHAEPTDFFPAPPTQQQFSQGGRHHERRFEVEYGIRLSREPWFSKQGDGIVTTWLEAVRV